MTPSAKGAAVPIQRTAAQVIEDDVTLPGNVINRCLGILIVISPPNPYPIGFCGIGPTGVTVQHPVGIVDSYKVIVFLPS